MQVACRWRAGGSLAALELGRSCLLCWGFQSRGCCVCLRGSCGVPLSLLVITAPSSALSEQQASHVSHVPAFQTCFTSTFLGSCMCLCCLVFTETSSGPGPGLGGAFWFLKSVVVFPCTQLGQDDRNTWTATHMPPALASGLSLAGFGHS